MNKNGDTIRKVTACVANSLRLICMQICAKSPKVQRASQPVLLRLSATLGKLQTIMRDITQVYVQGYEPLTRPVFFRDTVLNVPTEKHRTQCGEVALRDTRKRSPLVRNKLGAPHRTIR